jgi:hypothetical protein
MSGADWLGRDLPREPMRPFGASPAPPASRRFLLVDPGGMPSAVWIDSPAACSEFTGKDGRTPRCAGAQYHVYFGDHDRRWLFRCPKSLSKDEQALVFTGDEMGEKLAKERIREMRGRRRQPRRAVEDSDLS